MRYVAPLGGEDRAFELTPDMAIELEKRVGTSIGLLFQRLRSHTFYFNDGPEIIRHALIGAGTNPQAAAEIVDTWVRKRPILETLPLAFDIMFALLGGEAPQEGTDNG